MRVRTPRLRFSISTLRRICRLLAIGLRPCEWTRINYRRRFPARLGLRFPLQVHLKLSYLGLESIHWKDQTVEEPRIEAGVNEGAAYHNDQQCRYLLDAPAPDSKRHGDCRTKGRPQKGQYEYQQSHGDCKDQECLDPSDEPADSGGEGCDRSQEGSGSTDAYHDKSSAEHEALLWGRASHAVFPDSAAHTYDIPDEGQTVGLSPHMKYSHANQNQPDRKLDPAEVGSNEPFGTGAGEGHDDTQNDYYAHRANRCCQAQSGPAAEPRGIVGSPKCEEARQSGQATRVERGGDPGDEGHQRKADGVQIARSQKLVPKIKEAKDTNRDHTKKEQSRANFSQRSRCYWGRHFVSQDTPNNRRLRLLQITHRYRTVAATLL